MQDPARDNTGSGGLEIHCSVGSSKLGPEGCARKVEKTVPERQRGGIINEHGWRLEQGLNSRYSAVCVYSCMCVLVLTRSTWGLSPVEFFRNGKFGVKDAY